MKVKIVVVWFKRDLRLYDHQPIVDACESGYPVLPLYIIEPSYWQQPFASRRHWHFIHDSLLELRQSCKKKGQGLVVRVGETIDLLNQLSDYFDIQGIYAHEENGNSWTYKRDIAVLSWCKQQRIPCHESPSNGVIRRLQSRDDWSKIRNYRMMQSCIAEPDNIPTLPSIRLGDIPTKDDALFGEAVPGIVQTGGRKNGLKVLNSFLNQRSKNYLYNLSTPIGSEHTCSRLSPHIAWGTLSVREITHATALRRRFLAEGDNRWKRPLAAFSTRLAWRCHFVQKIEDQPSIETRCMHPSYEGLRSDTVSHLYEAWQTGQTGYPFVDACMRNLVYEGWITFRMRAMLVSFASYHCWLDWRQTGNYLARIFTDYEPGIHYSQLQMQSGVTGINAVRIYNPIKQSIEHDPEGEYIKKWVPELRNVPTTFIHEPWLMPKEMQHKSHCVLGEDYPAPIVEHEAAVKLARQKMSVVRKSENFKKVANKVYDKLGSRKQNKNPKRVKKQTKQISLF